MPPFAGQRKFLTVCARWLKQVVHELRKLQEVLKYGNAGSQRIQTVQPGPQAIRGGF